MKIKDLLEQKLNEKIISIDNMTNNLGHINNG